MVYKHMHGILPGVLKALGIHGWSLGGSSEACWEQHGVAQLLSLKGASTWTAVGYWGIYQV